MRLITIISLASGGLFAGSIFSITWDRLPAWRHMAFSMFQADFGRTIRIADKLQPVLLLVVLVTTVSFGFSVEGVSRTLALIAGIGYAVVFVASLAILVPLQRKILGLKQPKNELLQKWSTGHIGRTVLAVISFVFGASAVVFSS